MPFWNEDIETSDFEPGWCASCGEWITFMEMLCPGCGDDFED